MPCPDRPIREQPAELVPLDDPPGETDAAAMHPSGPGRYRQGLSWNAGPIVGHANPAAAGRPLSHGQRDAPAPTRERVERVLDEQLDDPFQQHGIPSYARRPDRRFDVDDERVGERGDAGAEVAGHPIDDRRRIDCLARRLGTHAFHTLGHAVQPVEVGPHVRRHGEHLGIALPTLLQQVDPSADTRQRPSQFVGRVADHAGPQRIRRGVARHAGHASRSNPRYGRSAAGTVTDPSACWWCSSRQAMVRGKASPDPLSVCTNRGFSPAAGR